MKVSKISTVVRPERMRSQAYPKETSIRRFMDQVRQRTKRRIPLRTEEHSFYIHGYQSIAIEVCTDGGRISARRVTSTATDCQCKRNQDADDSKEMRHRRSMRVTRHLYHPAFQLRIPLGR